MKHSFIVKLTIISMSFAMMSDSVVVPLVSQIFATYPEASAFSQNFIISGTALMMTLVSLLSGKLAQHFSKKDLLIVGFSLFTVAGIGSGLVNSVVLLSVCRGLTGVAIGLISPLALGLISELYIDIKERSGIIGVFNGMMAAFGAVMSIAAGYIAVTNWQAAFFINAIAIPVLILTIVFLPRTPPEKQVKHDSIKVDGSVREKIPALKLTAISVSAFFMNTLYCVIFYCIALYITERNLGDSSVIGILSSLGTLGSFAIGMMFSVIYMRTKRFSPTIFFILLAASYFVLSMPVGIIPVGLACAVGGACYGMSYSYYIVEISEVMPAHAVSMGMAIITSVIGVSMFLAPYVIGVYESVFNVRSISETFLYIAITLLACGVLSLILSLRDRKLAVASELE